MKALITNGIIELKPRIPSDWVRPNGTMVLSYITKPEYHFEDGWRDFVEPAFDPFNYKKTSTLFEDGNNTVSYEVIEMTQVEKDNYAEAQIPLTLTASQVRQALIMNGIPLNSVIEAINALPSPEKDILLVRWEYEDSFRRTSDEVIGIASALELTNEQLTQIYVTGSQL